MVLRQGFLRNPIESFFDSVIILIDTLVEKIKILFVQKYELDVALKQY